MVGTIDKCNTDGYHISLSDGDSLIAQPAQIRTHHGTSSFKDFSVGERLLARKSVWLEGKVTNFTFTTGNNTIIYSISPARMSPKSLKLGSESVRDLPLRKQWLLKAKFKLKDRVEYRSLEGGGWRRGRVMDVVGDEVYEI